MGGSWESFENMPLLSDSTCETDVQGRGLVAGEENGRAKAFREEKHEIWEIRSEKQQLLEWLVQASICWNSRGEVYGQLRPQGAAWSWNEDTGRDSEGGCVFCHTDTMPTGRACLLPATGLRCSVSFLTCVCTLPSRGADSSHVLTVTFADFLFSFPFFFFTGTRAEGLVPLECDPPRG